MTLEQKSVVRARLLAALLLFVVFVAGGVVGASAYHLLRTPEAVAAPGRIGDGREARGDDRESDQRRGPVSQLSDRLDLTPEQSERVRVIMRARRERIGAVLREVEPRIEAQRDTTDQEIRAILTAEQEQAFDRMIRRRDEPRDNRVRPPDGPPPAPGL